MYCTSDKCQVEYSRIVARGRINGLLPCIGTLHWSDCVHLSEVAWGLAAFVLAPLVHSTSRPVSHDQGLINTIYLSPEVTDLPTVSVSDCCPKVYHGLANRWRVRVAQNVRPFTLICRCRGHGFEFLHERFFL